MVTDFWKLWMFKYVPCFVESAHSRSVITQHMHAKVRTFLLHMHSTFPKMSIHLLGWYSWSNLFTSIGIVAESNTCSLCGGSMRMKKDGNHWFWVCTRRVNGVKCNTGKKSICTGNVFGNSHLSTQEILQIFWHFVHHLSEKQCVQYTQHQFQE